MLVSQVTGQTTTRPLSIWTDTEAGKFRDSTSVPAATVRVEGLTLTGTLPSTFGSSVRVKFMLADTLPVFLTLSSSGRVMVPVTITGISSVGLSSASSSDHVTSSATRESSASTATTRPGSLAWATSPAMAVATTGTTLLISGSTFTTGAKRVP